MGDHILAGMSNPVGAALGNQVYGEEWQAKLRWQRESAEQSNRQRALEMAMATLQNHHGTPLDADKVLALAERYFRFISPPLMDPARLRPVEDASREDSIHGWVSGFRDRAARYLNLARDQIWHIDLGHGDREALFAWPVGAPPSKLHLLEVMKGETTADHDGLYFEVRRARHPVPSRTERSPDDPAGLAI